MSKESIEKDRYVMGDRANFYFFRKMFSLNWKQHTLENVGNLNINVAMFVATYCNV